MATARLRKAFRYQPGDSQDDDDITEVLDEEEQEKLIAKLHKENEEQNEYYKRISLVIPTSAAMAFVPVLFVSQPLQAKLICLLSISSLICTAYILIFIPNSRAEPANHKQPMTISQSTTGPIHRYISYLNGGLSILILLNALKFKNQQGVHESFWVLCIVPSVVLLIIVTVKRLMRAVDLSELEALRYEYKGA